MQRQPGSYALYTAIAFFFAAMVFFTFMAVKYADWTIIAIMAAGDLMSALVGWRLISRN